MAARGPMPTPTETLRARGSWLANTRKGEPQFPVEVPSCPAWLSKEAKAEWRRIAKQLRDARIIAKVDRALLTAYCDAWGEFVGLCGRIQKLPVDEVPVSLIFAKRAARASLLQLAQQFGLSAASRTRVRVMESGGDEGPRLAEFSLG